MTSTITKVTATELARNLSDILNRVKYRDERFVVMRSGEVVARIEPAEPEAWPTIREIAERLKGEPMPGDGFADDLEKIQASQPLAEIPEWPS